MKLSKLILIAVVAVIGSISHASCTKGCSDDYEVLPYRRITEINAYAQAGDSSKIEDFVVYLQARTEFHAQVVKREFQISSLFFNQAMACDREGPGSGGSSDQIDSLTITSDYDFNSEFKAGANLLSKFDFYIEGRTLDHTALQEYLMNYGFGTLQLNLNEKPNGKLNFHFTLYLNSTDSFTDSVPATVII